MGREALLILRGAGLKSAIAFGLNIVGRVACRSGRYAEALELLEQARAVNHEIGDQPEELESDVRIAECLAMQGRSAQALELATAALVRSETLGGPATPQLQRVRGCALAQLGRLSEARVALQESVDGARDREAEYEEALALHGLARIAAIEGEPGRARTRGALPRHLRAPRRGRSSGHPDRREHWSPHPRGDEGSREPTPLPLLPLVRVSRFHPDGDVDPVRARAPRWGARPGRKELLGHARSCGASSQLARIPTKLGTPPIV